jgi:aspartate/methionine/tyrosine aminotransferase
MKTSLTERYGELRPEDVPPAGIAETRSAVARHTGVRPEEVVITAGACLGLTSIMTLGRVRGWNRVVLCPRPHFPAYSSVALLQGFALSFYDLRPDQGWTPDVDALEKTILAEKPGMVLWNVPHNPTGAVFDREVTDRVLAAAEAAGSVVVMDEVFADLVFDGEQPQAPALSNHLYRLGGFNKRFPSLCDDRVAYVLAPASAAADIALIHRTIAVGASVTSQKAARTILEGDTDSQLSQLRSELRRNRDYAVERLRNCPGISVEAPHAGLFVWFRLPDGTDTRRFSTDLRERTGVWCAGGHSFGYSAEPWARLRFAVPIATLRHHCDAIEGFLR